MKRLVSFILLCICCTAPQEKVYAADFAMLESQIVELRGMVRDLKVVVDAQQKEIAVLKGQAVAVTQSPTSSQETKRTLQGRWNPDIGVVGDIVFMSDSPKLDEEGADRVSVRELEIIFGSAVDPYSRFDAALAIADFEEMEVEEAYLTRFGLPLDLTARVGRFLPRIGKSIAVHRDSLDTVDEPMVIERYFGHHGFSKTGVDVTRALDLPTPFTHQITMGVLEGGNGEEGALFGETRRHPTVYSNLKNYIDLSDATGLELGLSHLAGSRDDDSSFEVNVVGLDGTLIHRYGDQRHVKLQSEAFFVNRTESFYPLEDDDTGDITNQDLDDARHLWGAYMLADWRFHPQWATGLRFDDVQLIETDEDFSNPRQTERGYTGYLTFYQSEFTRWRVQYSHLDLTSGDDDNRVFIQGTIAIGEHKHKIT